MFASGDLNHWLIVDKLEIIGADGDKFYTAHPIPVIISSISCDSYTAVWYRRAGERTDPWVSIKNHGPGELMVYGGNSVAEHNDILPSAGGMDVYIRNVPPCYPSNVMGEFGGKCQKKFNLFLKSQFKIQILSPHGALFAMFLKVITGTLLQTNYRAQMCMEIRMIRASHSLLGGILKNMTRSSCLDIHC